jgi:hypothetical protein
VAIDSKASQNLFEFLKNIDDQVPNTRKTLLYVGGGAAMLLAYEGPLATEDVDVIGVKELLLKELYQRAGKGSEIHRETGYYLDIVPPGKFPQEWGWKGRALSVGLPDVAHIELKVLELHDLILSKLKRFAGKDQEDIKWLCDRTEFSIETLRARYRSARTVYDYDEREKLDSNFRFVEEEFLALEPTEFD